MLREEHRFTNARTAQAQSWYSFSSGFRGITYGLSFAQGGRIRVELTLDTGEVESTKRLFDILSAQRARLDAQLGELSWERLDNRRSCRIALYEIGSIDDPIDRLDELKHWSVMTLLRFREVFAPLLKDITSMPSPDYVGDLDTNAGIGEDPLPE